MTKEIQKIIISILLIFSCAMGQVDLSCQNLCFQKASIKQQEAALPFLESQEILDKISGIENTSYGTISFKKPLWKLIFKKHKYYLGKPVYDCISQQCKKSSSNDTAKQELLFTDCWNQSLRFSKAVGEISQKECSKICTIIRSDNQFENYKNLKLCNNCVFIDFSEGLTKPLDEFEKCLNTKFKITQEELGFENKYLSFYQLLIEATS